jgi:hypothetical protein
MKVVITQPHRRVVVVHRPGHRYVEVGCVPGLSSAVATSSFLKDEASGLGLIFLNG